MLGTLKNFKKLVRTVMTIVLAVALVVPGLFVAPAHAAIKSDTPHTDTVSGNELLNLADKKPEGYDETSDKHFGDSIIINLRGKKKTSLIVNNLNRRIKYYVKVTPYKVYKGHKYIGISSKKKKVRVR